MPLSGSTASIHTDRLELVALTTGFVQALVAGRMVAAGAHVGARVGRSLTSDPSHIVQLHLAHQAGEAAGFDGLGRVIVLRGGPLGRRVIGSIGFHGGPDERGRMEVGCHILPDSRGCGYAAEALNAVLGWAAAEFGVARFLVAVPSPRESRGLLPVEMAFGRGASFERSTEGLAKLLEGAVDVGVPQQSADRRMDS